MPLVLSWKQLLLLSDEILENQQPTIHTSELKEWDCVKNLTCSGDWQIGVNLGSYPDGTEPPFPSTIAVLKSVSMMLSSLWRKN